ncbi:protein O-mannosyl-transferase TMTC1 [Procambarus clarkii]|uniref:protein O-mannosyl-transferase TMTC1 n=1 Tax=Procambarus clarkii TaxID=6728 RepID=UPI003743B2FB
MASVVLSGGEVLEPPPATRAVLEPPPATRVVLEPPPATRVVPEPPPATRVVLEQLPATREVPEPPPATRVVLEPPPATREVLEPPPATRAVLEPPPATREVLEPPPATRAVLEPPPANREVLEPPPATRQVLEPPPATREVLEPPPATREVLEPPPATRQVLEPPPATREAPEPPPATREAPEPPPATRETPEPPPATKEVLEPHPATRETPEPPPATRETPEPPPATIEAPEPPPATRETPEPPPATKDTLEPHPATREASEPPPATREASEPPPATREASEPPPATREASEPHPATREASEPPPATREAPEPPPATRETPEPPPATREAPEPPPATREAPEPPPATREAPEPPPATREAPEPPPTTSSTPNAAKFWSCMSLRPEALSRDALLHKRPWREKHKDPCPSVAATRDCLPLSRKDTVQEQTTEVCRPWPAVSAAARSARTTKRSSGHSSSSSSSSAASLWQQLCSSPTPTQLYVVLAATSVLVYVTGVTGEYVHDDLSAVLKNPDVQGTRPLWQLFFNDFWGKSMADPASHKSYRPLTILTFRLGHWVWGNNSLADHTINVFLHGCVTLLYARTLLATLRLTLAETLASGLLFATHPVHTEAVTGLVGRADLLAAAAFLASFTAYHRSLRAAATSTTTSTTTTSVTTTTHAATRRTERVWLWWAGLWACVGVLCKEHALTVLGVCVAWDLTLSAHTLKRLVVGRADRCVVAPLTRRTGKLICLALMTVVMRLALMRSSPVFSDQDNPASFANSSLTRFLTFCYLPAHNVWLLLCPASLSYDWQMASIPLVSSLLDTRNTASLALYTTIILLLLSALRSRRRERLVVVWALLVLCLPFLPASNAFFRVGFVLAERLLYIPSLGWCAIVGVGAARAATVVPGRAWRHLLLALLLTFSIRTARRSLDWRSRDTLFTSGLRTLPHNAKMHYNYANLQRDVHNHDAAVHHYKEAIRLWWRYPSAHNNLGTLLLERHLDQQAEWHFSVALQIHPRHPHAALNLATLWGRQGRVHQAVSLLESIFIPEDDDEEEHEEEGDHEDEDDQEDEEEEEEEDEEEEEEEEGATSGTGRLLADLYLQEGRWREAEGVYISLISARPSDPTLLAHYAAFLHKLGRHEAAARQYEAALSLDPTHAHALANYAALMNTRDHHNHAHRLYSRALACQWDADTATALARLCILRGQLGEAHRLLHLVTHRHPQHLSARVHLAQVKLQQKQYSASEALLGGVLEESPGHQEALYHFSLLLSATNRSEEALAAATAAATACKEPRELCALLHAHQADLLHTFSRMDAAVLSYQLAVRMEPALSRAHLNLGAIYHTQGRYGLALEHYNTALSQDPTNTLLLENMEKLHRAMNAKFQGR